MITFFIFYVFNLYMKHLTILAFSIDIVNAKLLFYIFVKHLIKKIIIIILTVIGILIFNIERFWSYEAITKGIKFDSDFCALIYIMIYF